MKNVLKHLYISPLEMCNLHCKICYTAKTKSRLSSKSILDFIDRYAKITELQTITFCGGEVCILADFPAMINKLTDSYFVQIITNGTVDVLEKFSRPNMINLIVSLDGMPEYHDKNRGNGMWERSTSFMKKASHLGFHLEVFSIVTKENMSHIERFEKTLNDMFESIIPVTYHPRKPMRYLRNHPVSNIVGEIEQFSFIDSTDRLKLGSVSHIFPPLDLNCAQISLMSDGQVYGCCEGITQLGSMTDEIPDILKKFEDRVEAGGNCVEPDFRCGLEEVCHWQA